MLQQQIISICEGSVPFWGPMITQAEKNMLERCLKTGLHIIYQEQYSSYSQVLKLAGIKSLKIRRLELLTRFGKSAIRNDKYKNWFCPSEEREDARTRSKPVPLLKPVPGQIRAVQSPRPHQAAVVAPSSQPHSNGPALMYLYIIMLIVISPVFGWLLWRELHNTKVHFSQMHCRVDTGTYSLLYLNTLTIDIYKV